ncbi:MAG: hypothetical protein R8N23_06065 [Reichenbachiella sp.]|uniref:hypothetical protein n=1 Tax=Reichenbachiella sp. TaxID=2184521 RepID=UPI0029671E45|nr:hypothetical protein [Reichenbachiella sp.]MDW3209107.1 hypothetical protein [Reichenbachiella sp.]MDW3209411.1 hypothetical protein [Reichenbachiella sp.]
MKNLIIAIQIIILVSCTSKSEILTENGKIKDGTFYCDKFDWEIDIPEGYTITSLQEKEDLEELGYDAMKTEVPEGYEVRENRPHLIGFEIDEFNSFSSSLEPFGSTKMSMEEHQKFVSDLLKKTYNELEGVKFEQELSTENIGQRKFYNIKTKLFNQKTDELILTQVILNTKIGADLFSSSINYKSEDVFETLYNNFKKSLN